MTLVSPEVGHTTWLLLLRHLSIHKALFGHYLLSQRLGRQRWGAGSSFQCGLGAVWKDGFLPTAMHLPLVPQGIIILSFQKHPRDSERPECHSPHTFLMKGREGEKHRGSGRPGPDVG